MTERMDLSGIRFGKLTAISQGEKRKGKRPLWACRCDCGGIAHATNGELRSGRKISCPTCSRQRSILAHRASGFGAGGNRDVNFKHGAAQRDGHTKEYRAWASMISRCERPSQRSYTSYGGRGISVCPQWRASFETFLSDVGRAPSAAHTIDREDVNGNYEPANVRWALGEVQSNNKRTSVRIDYGARCMTLAEWATLLGIKYQTLWARIYVHKWPLDRALTAHSRHPSPLVKG